MKSKSQPQITKSLPQNAQLEFAQLKITKLYWVLRFAISLFIIFIFVTDRNHPAFDLITEAVLYLIVMILIGFTQNFSQKIREFWIPKVMSGAYWDLMTEDGYFNTDEYCIYSTTQFSDINAGGDFYRAEVRGESIVLIIGDVVSHGIAVSQGAVVCLSAFKAVDSDDPKLILEAVNRALLPIQKEHGGETFAFIIKMDKSGVCTYNGLAERATLLSMDGKTTINLQTYGSILGKVDSFIGENSIFRMKDGDNLILLTDGAANQDDNDDKTSIIISKNLLDKEKL